MDINRKIYEKTAVVDVYLNDIFIFPPEVLIFVNHKDQIYKKTVFDIGCGGGRLYPMFKALNCDYVGIDFSEKMIEACRARYTDGEFVHADMRSLDKLNFGIFDFAIIAFNSIDYIDHASRIRVIGQVAELLKPNGLLVLSSHNLLFHDIVRDPKLATSLNPFRQVKNIGDYFIKLRNSVSLKRQESVNCQHALLNDPAHMYGLLTYYVHPDYQMAQLTQNGFNVLEMYGNDGSRVDSAEETAQFSWIYYVAQKI